ncbi:MAG: hypothetical protein K2X47_00125 [Bdellovibrionales bacterium]|nr:hypothetical protein [Bdellovibrionales bacterium]
MKTKYWHQLNLLLIAVLAISVIPTSGFSSCLKRSVMYVPASDDRGLCQKTLKQINGGKVSQACENSISNAIAEKAICRTRDGKESACTHCYIQSADCHYENGYKVCYANVEEE